MISDPGSLGGRNSSDSSGVTPGWDEEAEGLGSEVFTCSGRDHVHQYITGSRQGCNKASSSPPPNTHNFNFYLLFANFPWS